MSVLRLFRNVVLSGDRGKILALGPRAQPEALPCALNALTYLQKAWYVPAATRKTECPSYVVLPNSTAYPEGCEPHFGILETFLQLQETPRNIAGAIDINELI